MLNHTQQLRGLGLIGSAATCVFLGVLVLAFPKLRPELSLQMGLVFVFLGLFVEFLLGMFGLFMDGSAKVLELRQQRLVIRERRALAEAGQLQMIDESESVGALSNARADEGQLDVSDSNPRQIGDGDRDRVGV